MYIFFVYVICPIGRSPLALFGGRHARVKVVVVTSPELTIDGRNTEDSPPPKLLEPVLLYRVFVFPFSWTEGGGLAPPKSTEPALLSPIFATAPLSQFSVVLHEFC